MTLRPQALPPVPEATVAAVQAAFPKGNLYWTVPGWEALRWRTGDEQPPAAVRMASPDDLEARYSRKRDTHWVGDRLHLTET